MRFSFTRVPVTFALGLGCLLIVGCPEQKMMPAPPGPPTKDAPPPPSNAVIQDSPKPRPNVEDAGAQGTAPAAADGDSGAIAEVAPASFGPLETFAGFSRDETSFAFAQFAEAAGTHILQFARGQRGTSNDRVVLDSEQSNEKAKALLEEGGFTPKKGELPAGMSVEAAAMGGKAQVTLTMADGTKRKLYDGNPFALGPGGAKVQAAKVGPISPSGRVVAVQVDSNPMSEFGGVTTYVLVSVGDAK